MRYSFLLILLTFSLTQALGQLTLNNKKIDGYKGIWFTLGQFSEYGDKYSGGLGTYTAKHRPLAIYAPEAEKTFFVYGGTTSAEEKHLLCMISYYDHQTGKVPKPTVVHDKLGVDDPHDDPSLAIDSQGYLWVFVSGRGRSRPGFKYRSDEPYDIGRFRLISEEEMTYPQPQWDASEGFFHFFTKYTGVRELYFETSKTGYEWTEDVKLAGIVEPGATRSGHYQVSDKHNDLVCTFFNRHPDGNVDKRTDLYYIQTRDFGKTWTSADGEEMEIPLTDVDIPARVNDYASLGKNVYLKDINFDENGYPVCLYITSGGHEPGPKNDPREWRITRYNGAEWETTIIGSSDHNYDMGSLYIDKANWMLIAPIGKGPQPYQTGGEVEQWISQDAGITWTREKAFTMASKNNHTYVRRPVNAKDPFFAFWADGDPTEFSKSYLYFSSSDGHEIYQLPYHMEHEFTAPILIEKQ